MLALIHRTPGDDAAGTLPIAGKPLTVRQLQYLRALGARRVAVEHAASLGDQDIRAWLVDEALATVVELVPTRTPIGAAEVARRANFPDDETIIALPASALFDADIDAIAREVVEGQPIRVMGMPPETDSCRPALRHAELIVARCVADLAIEPFASVASGGWGAVVRTLADALSIGLAALDGALPVRPGRLWSVQLHASEREPGVWLGRGATVAADARLVRPVLIAPGAVVKSGAEVGPGAIVSDGAVIERGVRVRDALILEGTVVGEGLAIERVAASARGLVDLETGERFAIDDEAMLSARDGADGPGVAARLVALVLLVTLLPLALVLALADVGRGRSLLRRSSRIGPTARLLEPSRRSGLLAMWIRLLDVPRGQRALVGVTLDPSELAGFVRGPRPAAETEALVAEAAKAVAGAIAIDDALTPFDRSPEARLRGMAWYAIAKSARGDATLLRGALAGAPESVTALLHAERSTFRPPARAMQPVPAARATEAA